MLWETLPSSPLCDGTVMPVLLAACSIVVALLWWIRWRFLKRSETSSQSHAPLFRSVDHLFNDRLPLVTRNTVLHAKDEGAASVTSSAPWRYLSLMGCDNTLGYTAPATPSPPYNAAHDSLLSDLLYHYGGVGRGSNPNVHMVCLASDLNEVTNVQWSSVLCSGTGVAGSYAKSHELVEFTGDTGFADTVKSHDRFDSSDPETLLKFLQYSSTLFPSTYTCLVLWGHSYAWCPDALQEDCRGSKNGVPRFMPVDVCPLYSERPTTSLQTALAAAGGVDVLCFDSCMGASLENLYILRHVAKIVVGNCDYTGWKGLDNAAVGNALRDDDSLKPWALAEVMVNHFAPQLDGTLNYAISAYRTDTGAPEALRLAVGRLAFELICWMSDEGRDCAAACLLRARQSITWADYNTGVGGNGGVDELFADASRIVLSIKAAVVGQPPLKSTDSVTNDILLACDHLLALLMDSTQSYSVRRATGSFEGLCCLNFYFPSSLKDYQEVSDLPSGNVMYRDIYETCCFNSDPFPADKNTATTTATGYASWSSFLRIFFSKV